MNAKFRRLHLHDEAAFVKAVDNLYRLLLLNLHHEPNEHNCNNAHRLQLKDRLHI
jgi:hypothetical protein